MPVIPATDARILNGRLLFRGRLRAPGLLRLIFMIVTAAFVAVAGCASSQVAEIRERVRSTPAYQFDRYDFDADRPLHRRVGPMPPHVLEYVRALDERPDYQSYKPTAAEMRLIRRSLDRLPVRLKRNLQRRGLGIYFIDDFLTSGLTDWAVSGDPEGESPPEIYSYMIFHAESLRTSMQDLLNKREASCFRPDDSGTEVEIRLGGNESAFMYLLMHEAVHALDYSERISPYVEPSIYPYQRRIARDVQAGALIDRVWSDYREAGPAFDFAGRDSVTFYGFRGGPRLAMAEAPGVYSGLSKSPFISLYGSQIWPEDLAELVSMYYLTEASGRNYTIRIKNNGRDLLEYEPLKFPAVRERLKNLRQHFDQ